MEWIKVKEFAMHWRPKQNTGFISLQLNDGKQTSIQLTSVSDLAAYSNILRNQSSVYYNPVTDDLTLGEVPQWEPHD